MAVGGEEEVVEVAGGEAGGVDEGFGCDGCFFFRCGV